MHYLKKMARAANWSLLLMALVALFAAGKASAYTMQDLLDADARVVAAQGEIGVVEAEQFYIQAEEQRVQTAYQEGTNNCYRYNTGQATNDCVEGYRLEMVEASANIDQMWADYFIRLDAAVANWQSAIFEYNQIHDALYGG